MIRLIETITNTSKTIALEGQKSKDCSNYGKEVYISINFQTSSVVEVNQSHLILKTDNTRNETLILVMKSGSTLAQLPNASN